MKNGREESPVDADGSTFKDALGQGLGDGHGLAEDGVAFSVGELSAEELGDGTRLDGDGPGRDIKIFVGDRQSAAVVLGFDDERDRVRRADGRPGDSERADAARPFGETFDADVSSAFGET